MLEFLKSRLVEPSTHLSLAGFLQLGKTLFPQYAAVIDSGSAFFLALAAARKG